MQKIIESGTDHSPVRHVTLFPETPLRRKIHLLCLAFGGALPLPSGRNTRLHTMRSLLYLFLFSLVTTSTLHAGDPPEPNYVFWGELVRIVDGNTVAMNLDLGFGVWVHNQNVTLLDADKAAPDEAAKAKNMQRVAKMRELLAESTDIVVKTVRDKDAKPPRYLATIWADGTNVNEEVNKVAP